MIFGQPLPLFHTPFRVVIAAEYVVQETDQKTTHIKRESKRLCDSKNSDDDKNTNSNNHQSSFFSM